jgi:hypothetical protein
MERDVRRARSQWRGCYTFEDIICDGDGGSSPKRTGGLKMGSTYYYYVCYKFIGNRTKKLTFIYSTSSIMEQNTTTRRYRLLYLVLTFQVSRSIFSGYQLKSNHYAFVALQ